MTTPGATATSSFTDLADGIWYLHVRALSGSGLPSPISTYTLNLDTTAPSSPVPVSLDHNTTEATNQNVVTMDWSGTPSIDVTSGLLRYEASFNTSPTSGGTMTALSGTTLASTALADGSWYFHMRALDLAGNPTPVVSYGPITIDSAAQPVGAVSVDRFIELWDPRVTSDTWGPDYLATPGYPPSILAEGFHGMNPVQQTYLITKLYDELRVADPAPGGLTVEELGYLHQSLFNFVFAKELAQANLTAPIQEGVSTLTRLVNQVTDSVPQLLQDLLAAPTDLYDAVDLNLPDLPGETFDDLTPDFTELDIPTSADVTSDVTADTSSVLDAIDNGTDDPIEDLERTVNETLTSVENDVDPSAIFTAVPTLPVSPTYQVCWDAATGNGCTTGVLATPTAIDVTGDGTSDLNATFGPLVDPANPSVTTLSYTLARNPLASDTSGEPIHAQVWIAYDVNLKGKRLLLGFDGFHRGVALSESTVASIGLPDVTKIASGDLDFSYAVTHTGPASKWALTLGLRNLSGDANPQEASLLFTPVANVHGHLTFTNDVNGANTVRTLDIDNTTDQPTVLDGVYHTGTASPAETTSTRFVVNKLPTTAHLHLERSYDGTTTTTDVHGTTSDRIDRVTVRRTVSTSDQRELTAVGLSGLPTDAQLHLTQADGRTTATYAAAAGAPLDNVAFVDRVSNGGGVIQRASSIHAASVPASVQAGFGPSTQMADDTMLWNWNATAGLPSAAFSSYDRSAATLISGKVTNLPPIVTASASKSRRHVDLTASSPIGSLELTISRNGGRVLHRQENHLTYVGQGDALGVGVKLTGLQQATADFADTYSGSADFLPGGQRFHVIGRSDDIVGRLDLSNVPIHTEFTLDRANLTAHLATSQSLNTAAYYLARRPGGPMIEGILTSLPTVIDIVGSLSPTAASATYTANLPLGDASLLYSSDTHPGDKSGTTLRVHAHPLPTSTSPTTDPPAPRTSQRTRPSDYSRAPCPATGLGPISSPATT